MGDDGELPSCPGCGEEIEAGWVKCPMCNLAFDKTEAQPNEVPKPTPPVQTRPTQAPAQPPPTPAMAQPPPTQAPVVQPPSPLPKMAGMKEPKLEADLAKTDEARRISEAAVFKSKTETEMAELQAKIEEKDDIIDELQKTIADDRGKLEALEKESERLEERERAVQERLRDVEAREEAVKKLDKELVQLEKDRSELEEERTKVKAQASSLTEIENKLAGRRKEIDELGGNITKNEAALEVSKRELDTMIEQYGDKLTAIKAREDKIMAEELRIQQLGARLEIEMREINNTKKNVEKEKAEITKRSENLFKKIQRAETRTKEMDKRDNILATSERKLERWEEDLRHTEIHLLSIQEEIDNCVYCSVKDRFQSVDKLLAEAKAAGADVDIAEEEVSRAKILLDEGEFEKAVERAKNAIRMARQAKRQYYSYGVRYTIKAVEKIIASIRELGVSTEEPDNMIKEAKEALSIEDYERAEDYAKMAERIVLHMEEKAEDISSTVKRLEEMIRQAMTEGRETGMAEELLTMAKDQAKQGEYGSSIETLREAEDALIEQQVSSVQAGLADEETPQPGPPQEEYVEETPQETYYQDQTAYQDQSQGGYHQQPAQTEQQFVEQQQPVYQQPQVEAPPSSRFKCPYCNNIFEVRATSRPVTATCPYCSQKVMIN